MTALDGRIGKVRLKSNGAVLHVIEREASEDAHIVRTDLPFAVEKILEDLPNARGYVVVAWDSEGARTIAFHTGYPITTSMLPSFVADLLRFRIVELREV